MRFAIAAAILAFLLVPAAHGQDDLAYVENAGQVVEVFEHADLNYRVDLSGQAYTYVDFSSQVPEASFAALHLQPNVFSLVVVEDLGPGFSAGQYADIVQLSMEERFSGQQDLELKGFSDLGLREVSGMDVFQKTIYAEAAGTPITYVLSAIVDGPRAYQLLTFAPNASDDEVRAEADKLLGSFSIVNANRNEQVVVEMRSVEDYRSDTFGYRFRARARGWFQWTDLADSNDTADFGALSARNYGAVVMPVCWRGPRPNNNAIYRVIMQQFAEDYPSDFITEETDIEKDGASGKLLVGIEEADGQDFIYYQWIVANDQCAYTLAAWGPASQRSVRKDLEKLWKDFSISGEPGAIDGRYETTREREVNAYLLNTFGLHFYEARSYRDAFAYFSHAADLSPEDDAYLVNSLRALADIDAYREARDWLASRLGPFADDQVVQSWDAWLAYQTDDPGKAIQIYRDLFADGYRDDDDFSVYMGLLADAGRWEDLDQAFAAYTALGGESENMQLLHVQLLSRRERYAEALAVLDRMTEGRPFNPDLVYERIDILDEMGEPAEVLRLAELLLENGYRAAQSYYYKGDALYQLRSYREARESFEQALVYAPANAHIKDYLEAIDHMLGEGDTTTISTPIEPVPLPADIRAVFETNELHSKKADYGAVFLARISGYDFDGSDILRQTMYRKILILDDNGVTQFSTLEFDFDPAFEQLFVNRVAVRDADGRLIAEGDLDTYYITHSDTGYEASTEKTVHLPVPSLAPGAVIEAVVTKRIGVENGRFPLETVYMSTNRPIDYSAVFVSGNYDRLAYQLSGVNQPRKTGNALVWEYEQPVAFRWEPLQPYYDQILPWIQLGTISDSWTAAGEEYLQKIQDKLDIDEVADRAQRLVEGVDSEARRIEILSAYVQDEIHYEAIEFGRRAYIPKTARETLRDRYGDCKDHAVLLYAMLEAVGIDASLALVNLNQQIVPALPNTDQFDHMIVVVQTEAGPLFIDATDKDLRLGQLPPRSMAGNFALDLGETPELVRIPDYRSDLTGLSVERTVEPGTDGYLKVTEAARFSGYQAAEMRGQLRDIETSEMQASLQRWIGTRYSDAELTSYSVENVFDAGYDLLVEIQYTLPLETDGTFDVPGFLEAYYLEFDRISDRRFPFEHYFPLRVSAITSVEVPAGMRLEELAKRPDNGESRFGLWNRKVTQDNDRWQIEFDYVASDKRFAPEDYREFAEFQRKAVDAIEQPLILQ